MSLRVMIVPEDPANDRYILKPLVSAILDDLGERAHLQVLSNPRLRGFEQALQSVPEVLARYPTYKLFLVLLDRDGDEHRGTRLAYLESRCSSPERPVLGCLAHQEAETWPLGAQWAACRHRFPSWSWAEVRAERDVKERFFVPFFEGVRNPRLPGEGREQLMRGGGLDGLLQRGPELAELRQRIRDALATRP